MRITHKNLRPYRFAMIQDQTTGSFVINMKTMLARFRHYTMFADTLVNFIRALYIPIQIEDDYLALAFDTHPQWTYNHNFSSDFYMKIVPRALEDMHLAKTTIDYIREIMAKFKDDEWDRMHEGDF